MLEFGLMPSPTVLAVQLSMAFAAYLRRLAHDARDSQPAPGVQKMVHHTVQTVPI